MSTNDKLVPGMVLGRYELLLPIAQGGMATVWAARQKGSRGFQKTVAIKTMLPTLSDDPMFEQMFLDEGALAAKIHHPNVAEILDLGEQDEIIYLVMEWVDGEALSSLHKITHKNQVQFPYRIVLRVAVQACAGLHAAHELRDENDVSLDLVHRDVSPQNILVTYDGIVKLVDFGVAKAANRASAETSAGQLKGKVPYMSPEQARGGDVDRRTDIFAMGIVLYKMMTGIHPFTGATDLVTMRNIISRPLLSPRLKNPSFPPEVEQLLTKCLQKDPSKRYQTMLELGSAIERTLASMGAADDDIGGFVRSQLGERGAKRRAALREAVRVADERIATGAPPGPLPGAGVVHERLSDVGLTHLNSGIKPAIPSDRVSSNGSVDSSLNSSINSMLEQNQPSPLSTIPPSHLGEQSHVAVEVPERRRSRSGLFVGIGVAAIAAALAFALLRFTEGGASPPPEAADHVVAAAPLSSAPLSSAPSTDKPADVAPTASSSTLNVNDLPTLEDPTKKKLTSPTARASSDPRPFPGGTTPSTTKSARPVSTQWVPTVQNPGF